MTAQGTNPSDEPSARPHDPRRGWRAGLVAPLAQVAVRLYALMILLVVVGTTYLAVAYLFRSVFSHRSVPAQFAGRPANLMIGALESKSHVDLANPVPLGHYHQIGSWSPRDAYNGCTSSGCHSPLPHGRQERTRAFANLHVTFLACQTCHADANSRPIEAVWISTGTGQPQEPPALMQLAQFLETEIGQLRDDPVTSHSQILSLLGKTSDAARNDKVLDLLRAGIEAMPPGSSVWQRTVPELQAAMPHRFRGDYGAKLAPRQDGQDRLEEARALAEQTEQYLAAQPNSPRREQVYQRIHISTLSKPEPCLVCHGDRPPRLNLEALGYPPQRAASLIGPPVSHWARQVQTVEASRRDPSAENIDARQVSCRRVLDSRWHGLRRGSRTNPGAMADSCGHGTDA